MPFRTATALGAVPSQAMRMVLTEALALAGAGVIVGVLAGWMLSRYLGSLLFHVPALLAAYASARRAMRVDPAQSLRSE